MKTIACTDHEEKQFYADLQTALALSSEDPPHVWNAIFRSATRWMKEPEKLLLFSNVLFMTICAGYRRCHNEELELLENKLHHAFRAGAGVPLVHSDHGLTLLIVGNRIISQKEPLFTSWFTKNYGLKIAAIAMGTVESNFL